MANYYDRVLYDYYGAGEKKSFEYIMDRMELQANYIIVNEEGEPIEEAYLLGRRKMEKDIKRLKR